MKNAAGVYGVSYRWNAAQTEATLVPDEGVDIPLNIIENGNPRVQTWRIPSRAECITCHTPQAGHALSFNTRQLNLTSNMNGFAGNQIALLEGHGFLTNSAGSPNLLPRHVRPDETDFSVEARVRSYLARQLRQLPPPRRHRHARRVGWPRARHPRADRPASTAPRSTTRATRSTNSSSPATPRIPWCSIAWP